MIAILKAQCTIIANLNVLITVVLVFSVTVEVILPKYQTERIMSVLIVVLPENTLLTTVKKYAVIKNDLSIYKDYVRVI